MRARARRPAEPELVGAWMLGRIMATLVPSAACAHAGAAELLAELDAAGIPKALVTSSQRRIMDAVLASIGLASP